MRLSLIRLPTKLRSFIAGSVSGSGPVKCYQDFRKVGQGSGEVGAVAVRAGGGQLPADGDGFLGDRQRVGRAAQLREPDAEAGQGGGEVGAVAVRAGGGQLPVDGDGFLGDRQRVGRAAQLREPDAEVGQGSGEVGAVAVRAGGGQLPADGDGFLGDRQRVGRAAQLRERTPRLVSERRGRGGSGPGWRRPAPGRWRRLPR